MLLLRLVDLRQDIINGFARRRGRLFDGTLTQQGLVKLVDHDGGPPLDPLRAKISALDKRTTALITLSSS
jgi:hypothetical protein